MTRALATEVRFLSFLALSRLENNSKEPYFRPMHRWVCYPLAIGTMTDAKTKIKVIEDADATGEVARVYDEWRAHSGRQQMPGILKCFSHRPDFLREVMSFSNTVHFSEGHLTRRTKEAIASWVSWLNRCPY